MALHRSLNSPHFGKNALEYDEGAQDRHYTALAAGAAYTILIRSLEHSPSAPELKSIEKVGKVPAHRFGVSISILGQTSSRQS